MVFKLMNFTNFRIFFSIFFAFAILVLGAHGRPEASILDVAPPNVAVALFVRDLDGAFALVDGWKTQLDSLGVGAQSLDDLRKKASSDRIFRIFSKEMLQKAGVDTRKGFGLFIVADPNPSLVVAVGLGVEEAFVKHVAEMLAISEADTDLVAKQVSDRPVRRYLFSRRDGQPVAHAVLRSGYAFVSPDLAGVQFAETGSFAGPELTSRLPESTASCEVGAVIQFEHAARAFPVSELQNLAAIGIRDFVAHAQISETKTVIHGSILLEHANAQKLRDLSASTQSTPLSNHINSETDSFLRLFFPTDRVTSLLAEVGLSNANDQEPGRNNVDELRSEIQKTFRGDLAIVVPLGIQHTTVEMGINDEAKAADMVKQIIKRLAQDSAKKLETVEIVSKNPAVSGVRFVSGAADTLIHPTWYWAINNGLLIQAATEEAIIRRISTHNNPKIVTYGSNSLLKSQYTTASNLFLFAHADSVLFSWNDYLAVGLAWLKKSGLYVQDAIDLLRLAQDRWVDIAVSGDFGPSGFEFRCELTTLPPNNMTTQSSAVSDYTAALKAGYSGDIVTSKNILRKVMNDYPDSDHARKAKRTLFVGGQRWIDTLVPAALFGVIAGTSAFRSSVADTTATDDGFGVPDPAELTDPCVKLAQEVCYTFGEESDQCRSHFDAWNNPGMRYPEKRQRKCALELFDMNRFQ